MKVLLWGKSLPSPMESSSAPYVPFSFFSLTPKLGIFAQGAIAGVVYYGGVLVLQKSMTPGTLLSFLLYTLNVAVNIATLSALVGDFAQV